MNNSVDFESVLSLIDKAISPTYLNPTQEIVLREVWNGKTYSKMAYDYNYDPEYIKTVGCNLWQTLSRAFDEQINKSNFVPFMRQKIGQLLDEKLSQLQKDRSLSPAYCFDKPKLYNWTTAPNVQNFVGRQEELDTLSAWSENTDCRLIVVSGMTGSGKTNLVTKFADTVKRKFDCVIWFSLSQPPSLIELLNRYLNTIGYHSDTSQDSRPRELSFLLSEFIECLRQQKVLLVLDGLQHILKIEGASICYREEYEGYGQFLRSIVSTDHQSLLLTTSRIKPKLLEYYASSQVKFLDLQGLKIQAVQKLMNFYNDDTSIKEEDLLQLSNSLNNNPQLLKIASSHRDLFWEEDIEQATRDLCLVQAISQLLEKELTYLSPLEKEIVYWLAISCSPLTLTELGKYIEQVRSKLKFVGSMKSLVGRSLVIKENDTYSLMPIAKVYLRRKLVKQAL